MWVETIAANGFHTALCRPMKHDAHRIAPCIGTKDEFALVLVAVACTLVVHDLTVSEVILLVQNTREVPVKFSKAHA